MRFAYLILAHRDPLQLQALVRKLLGEGPSDHVLIHYDSRSPLSDAELGALFGEFGKSVAIVPRIACRWGHHSQVRATLLLQEAAGSLDYDYAHLISGQDWPAMPRARLVEEIRAGDCYLSIEDSEQAVRMTDYHFDDRMLGPQSHRTAFHYRMSLALRRAARLWTRLRGPRPCPLGPSWQRGSQWWSLPKAAVDRVSQASRALLAGGWLRHTHCADEHVVHTILYHSEFRDRLESNRRFAKWPKDGSSPEVLTGSDRPAIEASGCWFARKVDRNVDPFFLEAAPVQAGASSSLSASASAPSSAGIVSLRERRPRIAASARGGSIASSNLQG